MEINFRIYNNGEQQLVFVAFPTNGGSSVLRRTWGLDDLNLKCSSVPDRRNIPCGDHKIKNYKSLVRGGFSIEVDYKTETMKVTPRTRQRNKLQSKSKIYRIEDLGLQTCTSGDGTDFDERHLDVRAEKKPLDREQTYPKSS